MSNAYKWYVVAMLWLVCFLNYADRQAVFTLFPLLRSEFRLSDLELAMLGSSFMWMYALFGPIAGWLGDRLSRKGLILGGLCLWLCVTAATIPAHRFWQLVVLRGISGVAEAVYFPAAMSLISAYHGPGTRSRAMSVHQSAIYGGTVGGGVLGPLLGERFGWRINFVCFGAVGLCLIFVLLALLREPRTASAEPAIEERASLRDIFSGILGAPLVLRLVVAFIGANFVAMVFMVWLPTFLSIKFHMSLAVAGASATIYLQAASLPGVLSGGAIADQLARGDRGGRMRIQAVGPLAGVVFLFLTGWTSSVPVLIAALIGFGLSKGLYESNLWASLHDVVPRELRATAVGIMNSLGWIGGGVAPLAVAAGSGRLGMGACLSATSVVYACVGGILLVNARAARRQGAPVSLRASQAT